MTATEILNNLLAMTPVRTADLPGDKIGIYGLVDHAGIIRYIGSTSAANENFRKRIHQRHRTGSETYSHYFSKVYNCGRMFRDRLTQQGHADAKIAKDLRSAFVAKYCGAVCVPLIGSKAEIEALEAAVIRIAPKDMIGWNRSTSLVYNEPEALVDALVDSLGFGAAEREAVNRQKRIFTARQ
jgi:DNA polymerase III subunit epsilon